MEFSVEMHFDKPSVEKILHIRELLIQNSVSGLDFGYAYLPHLTLGFYEGNFSNDDKLMIDSIAQNNTSFQIVASHLGFFPNGKANLAFLGINKPPALTSIQIASFRSFDRSKAIDQQYYEPDNWLPHISIASAIKQPDLAKVFQAYRRAAERYGELKLDINSIGLAVNGDLIYSKDFSREINLQHTNRHIPIVP